MNEGSLEQMYSKPDKLENWLVEVFKELRENELPLPDFIESVSREFPCVDGYTVKLEIFRNNID